MAADGDVEDTIRWLNTLCCSTPDPDARRADDPAWQQQPEVRRTVADWLADALFCGACLRLRLAPGHLLFCRPSQPSPTEPPGDTQT